MSQATFIFLCEERTTRGKKMIARQLPRKQKAILSFYKPLSFSSNKRKVGKKRKAKIRKEKKMKEVNNTKTAGKQAKDYIEAEDTHICLKPSHPLEKCCIAYTFNLCRATIFQVMLHLLPVIPTDAIAMKTSQPYTHLLHSAGHETSYN